MNVQILGCVELRATDGGSIPVSPTVRLLLATLAWSPNSFIADEDVIDRIWDGRPPAHPRNALYTVATRLRKALRTVGTPSTPCDVVRRPGGYTLVTAEEVVDVFRFRALVRHARNAERQGAEGSALDLFEKALALCHSEPLSDVRTAWAEAARVTLRHELRIARVNCAELALRLGRYDDYVPCLYQLVGTHPLDERATGLLMTALYRSGRQDEALHCFRLTRSRLIAELGVEPGSELRTLHERILRRDEVIHSDRSVPQILAA